MQTRQEIELCLASQHFFPTHGGAQLRFLRYLPGLRKRGIHTRVFSGTPKAKKLERYPLEGSQPDPAAQTAEPKLTHEPVKDLAVHQVDLPDKAGWLRSITFNQALLRFCTQPGKRPDVLQIVSSLQPRSLPWVLRLRRSGIPVIYAYTIPVTLPSHPIRRAIRRFSWRLLYRQLDCLIVGSAVLRDLALEIGVNTRFEIIPNGVDLKRFRPAATPAERLDLRSSLGIGPEDQMITFVGAIHPRKGADLLLEAWVQLARRFPKAHLFLLGLRKDLKYSKLSEFRRRIETLIAASGAANRIHLPGVVRNVEEYLRASDIFVFPTLREGMPNAVLEAMASGLPVVLTPFVGLSEDLGKSGQEYLLADRDPEALVATIAEVLQDPAQQERFGRSARRWVQQTMDLERSLDRYANLYRQLSAAAKG